MNVKLLTSRHNVRKLQGKPLSTGLYSWEVYDFTEPTDYTGRWRVKSHNGNTTLYLECFELVERTEEMDITLTREASTVHRKFLFWSWEEVIPSFSIPGKKKVTKVKANVVWIPESELRIECTEDFINECSGGCDESN